MATTQTSVSVRNLPICDHLRCHECGALLMNTPSGSVCSVDLAHGGLQPHVAQFQLDAAWLAEWARSLPDAVGHGPRAEPAADEQEDASDPRKLYVIGDRDGYRMDPDRKAVKKKPRRLYGWTYAVLDGRIYRFWHPDDE